MKQYLEDILIFVGCVLMVIGGLLLAPVIAIYTAAVEFLIIGVLLARYKAKKGGGD